MGILNRLQLWWNWLTTDPLGFALYLLYFAVSVLLTLILHEIAHGYVAYRCGDPTAKMLGRLSLDPRKHLDPIGTLCLVFLGFGWAKPVPVDPRYFKNPKGGMAITALAGPLSNLLMAYLSALALGALSAVAAVRGETAGLTLWLDFFALMVSLNIGLGIFNLIPFPPLDGSKVVAMFLPDRWYYRWMQLERYGMVILMVALWFGVFDGFLGTARRVLVDWMLQGANGMFQAVLSLLV